MIRSFADKRTARFFQDGVVPAGWRTIADRARRKLDMLDALTRLEDFGKVPGNRLEALRGDRKGQWSVRINEQWRLCFRWAAEGPEDVEIIDYH
jgi:proteic killer suppression protein